MEALCRDLFLGNRESIKINKEEVAVKNLVKIVNAALKLCNRQGFAAMSLRDLSKEAGLSMGALYAYFTSKDELLRIMQQHGSLVVMRVLQGQAIGIDDPRARLRSCIHAHLYLSEVMQPWFYFSYMETKNLPKEEHKKAIEAELFTEKMLIDIIEEGQDKGIFKPVQTALLGAVIKAALQDWYLKRWKYARRKVSVEEYAAFLVDFIESYLVSPSS
ncbi:MAG: TetR/AcrR family transcriptional regulator [Desulfomonile tiedjei]|uniref:TetR/AcrR family transcriptional regulator n=1 Tax=Desulfomonile tiedjei TaxID=2358 RepID=A0A9D6V2J8_9BACT|nr:TetR/AcrR family transcriptional regulator [Desulfomonile tiedjei]